MTDIQIPNEFIEFCKGCHQDYDLAYKSPNELIIGCLAPINQRGRQVILEFIEELLGDKFTDEELQKIWWSTPAEINFPNDQDLRYFLRLLADVIISD